MLGGNVCGENGTASGGRRTDGRLPEVQLLKGELSTERLAAVSTVEDEEPPVVQQALRKVRVDTNLLCKIRIKANEPSLQ